MHSKIIKIIAFSLFSIPTFAQVGINTETPDASSILDINDTTKGILIPRLADPKTIANPATGLMVYDTTKKCLTQNIGNATTPDWVCLSANVVKFFYMPSIVIDTSTTTTSNKNLYQLYKDQFSTPKVSSFVTGSAGAIAPPIPYFPNASDLYYYVTDYDANVFSNISISSDGIMTYSVNVGASNSSYMNIVFVVK